MAALASNGCIRHALEALVEQGRVASGVERFTRPLRLSRGGFRAAAYEARVYRPTTTAQPASGES